MLKTSICSRPMRPPPPPPPPPLPSVYASLTLAVGERGGEGELHWRKGKTLYTTTSAIFQCEGRGKWQRGGFSLPGCDIRYQLPLSTIRWEKSRNRQGLLKTKAVAYQLWCHVSVSGPKEEFRLKASNVWAFVDNDLDKINREKL